MDTTFRSNLIIETTSFLFSSFVKKMAQILLSEWMNHLLVPTKSQYSHHVSVITHYSDHHQLRSHTPSLVPQPCLKTTTTFTWRQLVRGSRIKKKEIFPSSYACACACVVPVHTYVFLRLCLRRCVVRVNQPLVFGQGSYSVLKSP